MLEGSCLAGTSVLCPKHVKAMLRVTLYLTADTYWHRHVPETEKEGSIPLTPECCWDNRTTEACLDLQLTEPRTVAGIPAAVGELMHIGRMPIQSRFDKTDHFHKSKTY